MRRFLWRRAPLHIGIVCLGKPERYISYAVPFVKDEAVSNSGEDDQHSLTPHS